MLGVFPHAIKTLDTAGEVVDKPGKVVDEEVDAAVDGEEEVGDQDEQVAASHLLARVGHTWTIQLRNTGCFLTGTPPKSSKYKKSI